MTKTIGAEEMFELIESFDVMSRECVSQAFLIERRIKEVETSDLEILKQLQTKLREKMTAVGGGDTEPVRQTCNHLNNADRFITNLISSLVGNEPVSRSSRNDLSHFGDHVVGGFA